MLGATITFWVLGTVVGATQDIDMHMFQEEGVIRIQVGLLNMEQFPYTTDLVFGKVGYDITFTLEAEECIPAIPPLENDPNEQDDNNGNGAEDKTGNNGLCSLSKKHKTSEPKENEHNASPSGPAPMQIAVTPFLKTDLAAKVSASEVS